MINGIHHVALVVNDFDKMLEFYTEAVGFEKVFEASFDEDTPDSERVLGIAGAVGRMVGLKAGNAYFELHQYTGPEDRKALPADNRPCDQGIRHFCLDVTDIEEVYDRLKAAGLESKYPPTLVEFADIKSVYARDPEGNLVEVQELVTNKSGYSLASLEGLRPGAWTPT